MNAYANFRRERELNECRQSALASALSGQVYRRSVARYTLGRVGEEMSEQLRSLKSRIPHSGPAGNHRSPHIYPRNGNGPTSDRNVNWDCRELAAGWTTYPQVISSVSCQRIRMSCTTDNIVCTQRWVGKPSKKAQ